MATSTDIIFFDIGDTLARVKLPEVVLSVFVAVPRSLKRLRGAGCRIGIISNIGTIPPERVMDALQVAGLMAYIDPTLIVFGPKDTTETFAKAVQRANRVGRANSCAYVGEQSQERAHAIDAGLASLPPAVVLV